MNESINVFSCGLNSSCYFISCDACVYSDFHGFICDDSLLQLQRSSRRFNTRRRPVSRDPSCHHQQRGPAPNPCPLTSASPSSSAVPSVPVRWVPFMLSIDLLDSYFRFCQKRKRTTLLNQAKEASEESSDSEDPDDLDNDPTWKSGLTPAPPKAKSRVSSFPVSGFAYCHLDKFV